MSHHASDMDAESRKHFLKMLQESNIPLGATEKFPAGKIHKTDEGEIRLAIGSRGNKVVVDFGTPVAWIGFTKAKALTLAECIKHHADLITD